MRPPCVGIRVTSCCQTRLVQRRSRITGSVTVSTVVAIVVALALAACSGDSSGSDAGASPSTAAATSAVDDPVPATDPAITAAVSTTAGTSSSTSSSSTSTTMPVPRRPARPSDGCGTAPAVTGPAKDAPGDVALTFAFDGAERTYRLGIPTGYDPDTPAPLALNLHGAGSNAFQASTYSDLPARAAEFGVITVTPDAIEGRWDLGPADPDDAFLVALVTDVAAHYCVDLTRVHAVGMSLGAWRAGATACRHSDLFASAVLVTVEVWPQGCPPMSMIAFHGTADPVVPYGEGADPGVVVGGPNAGLSGARDNIVSWATGGGCDGGHDDEQIGDDVDHWVATGCPDGIAVELYTIHGGEHTWPGADITIGATTQTIDATDLALAVITV